MIGEKIRKVRELRGLKQEDLAEKLHISQNAYSKIERGETKVDIDRLKLIADLFEVDLYDLLNFEEGNVFNVNGNHGGTNSGIAYHYNTEIKEQYELLIKEQSFVIATLKEQIETLKKQIETLQK